MPRFALNPRTKTRLSLSGTASLVTALWLSLSPTPAQAQLNGFNFVNIANQSGEAFSEVGPPSINNLGQVTFFARVFQLDNSSPGYRGIFTGSAAGQLATVVADERGPIFLFEPPPSINDLGQVAFKASFEAASGIRAGIYLVPADGGAFTPLATTGQSAGTGQLGNTDSPSLNNLGQAAFRSTLVPGSAEGIFVASAGGPVTPIALAGVSGAPFSSFFITTPSLNDSGQVAFRANIGSRFGIFVGAAAGGPIINIADTDGPYSEIDSVPSINNLGQVVFSANLDAGGTGIFLSSAAGGPVTTIIDTSGAFAGVGSEAINNVGQVAFLGTLDAGGRGLFLTTTAGGPPQLVLSTGDPLFGSTITSIGIGIGAEGLNDSGQIAFTYRLQDQRFGVGIASFAASAVPEPGTVALLGVGLLRLAGIAVRRRSSRSPRAL